MSQSHVDLLKPHPNLFIKRIEIMSVFKLTHVVKYPYLDMTCQHVLPTLILKVKYLMFDTSYKNHIMLSIMATGNRQDRSKS